MEEGYFQMTVSMEHKILWKQMKEIKNKIKMDKFYFVVPDTHYKEFKKQKMIGGPDNQTTSRPSDENATSSIGVSEGVEEMNKENEEEMMSVDNEEDSEEPLVRQYVIGIKTPVAVTGWVEMYQQFMPVGQQEERDVEKLDEKQREDLLKLLVSSNIDSDQEDILLE
jgi:hypothetical protein